MTGSILLAAMASLPVAAAAADAPSPRIVVVGNGRVATPPDIATIEYRVVGEGATSDAAVTALVERRRATDAGIASLLRERPGASQVAINEVRGRNCQRNYGEAQLSVGDCAVVGYVASVSMTLRTASVAKAGTAVGLLGRLGAREPRLSDYALADPKLAQARAIADAVADARARAEAIGAATGAKLGPIVDVSTSGYGGGDIVVTGQRLAPPAPPPPPPPIAVDLTPRPIETQAQVTVTYAIER